MGGVPGAQKCFVSGVSGDRDITVQIIHSVVIDCTPFRASSYHTGDVDRARVGGVVKKNGLYSNDESWSPKYLK